MSGARTTWAQLPAVVRHAVEQQLGDRVARSTSQSSGFSDGSADRLRTESGRTAFVKAAQGAQSAQLHRREIAVLRDLPIGIPAARLLGSYDDGDWVVLVLDDVEGIHPTSDEAGVVLAALAALPVAGGLSLPPAAAGLGWTHPPVLPDLEFLVDLARHAPEAMAGDQLVHLDLRCDNLLITASGQAVIVDWPWASRGARWIDSLTFLLDARRLNASFDAENVLASHPIFESVDPRDVTAVLAALALTFFDAARRPSGVRGLRDFQRSEGDAALTWVRERTGV